MRRPTDRLGRKLMDLRADIARAAQKILDEWEQDADGVDEEFGTGGACDAIAQEIANGPLRNVETTEGGQQGDDHAFVIAYDDDVAYAVDIPPSVYETGGGYNWKKRKGVRLQADDVVIEYIGKSADLNFGNEE